MQFYAATNWDRDIKAIVLPSPFGNLPWKTRNILVQNEESFQKLIEASMKSLRDGTLDQVLPVKMRYFTGQDSPVTGQPLPYVSLGQNERGDGFTFEELPPLSTSTGPWSGIRATFPAELPTHSRIQDFYFDVQHRLRRLDYTAEVVGSWARAAHMCEEYREFDGLDRADPKDGQTLVVRNTALAAADTRGA